MNWKKVATAGFGFLVSVLAFAGLETGTYISDLVVTNPTSSDLASQGDDHLRLLKNTIKTTFPNITGAVTPTHTELNYVDGVTSALQTQLDAKVPTSNFPNVSGAVTPTHTELNYVDGVTSAIQTQLDGKLAVTAVPRFSYGVISLNGGSCTVNGSFASSNFDSCTNGSTGSGVVDWTTDYNTTLPTCTASSGGAAQLSLVVGVASNSLTINNYNGAGGGASLANTTNIKIICIGGV